MPYVFLFFFSSSCIWTFYLNSSCCTQACSLIYIVCFVAMLSVFHNSLKVYVLLFYLVNLSLFFFFERFTFITVSFTHLPILMGLGGLVDPKAIDEIFVENISTWPNLAEPPHHFRSFIYSDIHSQLNKRIL